VCKTKTACSAHNDVSCFPGVGRRGQVDLGDGICLAGRPTGFCTGRSFNIRRGDFNALTTVTAHHCPPNQSRRSDAGRSSRRFFWFPTRPVPCNGNPPSLNSVPRLRRAATLQIEPSAPSAYNTLLRWKALLPYVLSGTAGLG